MKKLCIALSLIFGFLVGFGVRGTTWNTGWEILFVFFLILSVLGAVTEWDRL